MTRIFQSLTVVLLIVSSAGCDFLRKKELPIEDDDEPVKKKKPKKPVVDDDDDPPVKKPKNGLKFSCTDTLAKLGEELSGDYDIKCPAGCETMASVWGTGWYTTDSAVCRAAIHAGAIEADEGGVITVAIEKGLAAYAGTMKKGVQTSSWGSYGSSFSINGSKNGNDAVDDTITCSDTLARFPGKKTITAKCPKGCTAGTVYGTDIYTSDSSICVAAVHAGVFDAADGGEVKIRALPGKSSYKGSTRNGVKTLSWTTPWGGSFELE
jgi:hypothetical protein